MTRQSTAQGKLSTIDRVFSLLDSPRRPLDFALLFEFKRASHYEGLEAGSKSARLLYPATGALIAGDRWLCRNTTHALIRRANVTSNVAATATIEDFLDQPLDLRTQFPVQQLLICVGNSNSSILVSRFHHAVADGVSASLWLGHQLRVASGNEPPIEQTCAFVNLRLRTHPAPVRRSKFSFAGSSDPLWSLHGQGSQYRRWITIGTDTAALKRRSVAVGGFSHNDLLATCALEVFTRWNKLHCGNDQQRIGLWLPINVRQNPSEGFGNGTSRVRIYASYPRAASFIEKCRDVRRQISWTTEHGEWAVPPRPLVTRLPRFAAGPLLRAYLKRPGVDMATGVFSHVERLSEKDRETFKDVERIESIGQLHTSYCLAINGATHGGRTWLTFTYDPAMLSATDVRRIVGMYEEEIERAKCELGNTRPCRRVKRA